MKIKKKRGPKIEPCGTPRSIGLGDERWLLIFVTCSLFLN